MRNITVMAEIGINHDGLYERAVQLIEAAANAGVHAVKFQYRNLENAYTENMAREIGDEILLREIRKNYLPPDELLALTELAHRLGMQGGVSFFDVKDIEDFGEGIHSFDFFKLPSAELANSALVSTLMGLEKHLYLSTGCHSEEEINEALSGLPTEGWTPFHCISNYPLALPNARLGYLSHMKRRWNREVGYSSHDDHWEVCLLAIQLGATVIERHITLNKGAEGLDHSSSSTPDEFARLCSIAAEYDLVVSGDGPRVPNQGELLNRQNLGRSYFAVSSLAEGHVLSAGDLVYRSPNIGINKQSIQDYLGKPLIQAVSQGSSIVPSMFIRPASLPEQVIQFARDARLSLPVRLHDLDGMQKLFPIGAYEFHLSFSELQSEIDVSGFDTGNSYSIHLPDYVNSTQLVDPFAVDEGQRQASLELIERTVVLAEKLQALTGKHVPVVGSFSVVHKDRAEFFENHARLLKSYLSRDVVIMPQWLPPIAWYFGGSVHLHAMNEMADAQFLNQYELPVCLDVCHMIMGRNFYGYEVSELIDCIRERVGHIHIADAAGIDGEGMEFGSGEPENLQLFEAALKFDCLKVIEVWQGHLDQGAGFRRALLKLEELYGGGK